MLLAAVAAVVVGVPVILKIYFVWTRGKYVVKADLSGKVVVLTGASSGIGKEAAIELAKHGAKLYLPVRNQKKGEDVLKEIKEVSGNSQVFLLECDFSVMDSVRKCAAEFMKRESKLNILMNNAGLFSPSGERPTLTADNMEMTMAANHFGPFLFTNLLLGHLAAGAPSRIVNTSSRNHYSANFDTKNPPTFQKGSKFDGLKAYDNSKFANVLFTHELSHRLHGTGITANSVSPGMVATNLVRDDSGLLIQFIIKVLMRPIKGKTPHEGAQTILHCALAPELEHVSGQYFHECKVTAPRLDTMDDQLTAEFWEISEKATGLNWKDLVKGFGGAFAKSLLEGLSKS